jgi:cell division protein FtsN
MSKRKPARRASERGSTLYGMLAGLLIGLVVAAVVAFYVTRAPVPFMDHASRHTDEVPLPDVKQGIDPNGALYGRDGAAGNPATGPTNNTPAPLPGVQPQQQAQPPKPHEQADDLGALIATLPPASGQPSQAATPAPSAPAAAPRPAPGKPAGNGNNAANGAANGAANNAVASARPASPPAASKEAGGTYFLQAGAYRGEQDAEALKARIIMLGLPVAVQRADVNGQTLHRVRVGPFARLDDMNRARSRLGENKIEVAVVRQQ